MYLSRKLVRHIKSVKQDSETVEEYVGRLSGFYSTAPKIKTRCWTRIGVGVSTSVEFDSMEELSEIVEKMKRHEKRHKKQFVTQVHNNTMHVTRSE